MNASRAQRCPLNPTPPSEYASNNFITRVSSQTAPREDKPEARAAGARRPAAWIYSRRGGFSVAGRWQRAFEVPRPRRLEPEDAAERGPHAARLLAVDDDLVGAGAP